MDHEALMNALTRHAESVAERVLESEEAGIDISLDVQRAIENVMQQRELIQAAAAAADVHLPTDTTEEILSQDIPSTSEQTKQDDTMMKDSIKTALISAITKLTGSPDVPDSSNVHLPDDVMQMLASNDSGMTPQDLVMMTDMSTGQKVITTKQHLISSHDTASSTSQNDITTSSHDDLSGQIDYLIDSNSHELLNHLSQYHPNELQEMLSKHAALSSSSSQSIKDAKPHDTVDLLKQDGEEMKKFMQENKDRVMQVMQKSDEKIKPAIILSDYAKDLLKNEDKLRIFLKNNVSPLSKVLQQEDAYLSQLDMPVVASSLMQSLLINVDSVVSLVHGSPELIELVLLQRQREKSRMNSDLSNLERQKSRPVVHADEFRVGHVDRDDFKHLYGAQQSGGESITSRDKKTEKKPSALEQLAALQQQTSLKEVKTKKSVKGKKAVATKAKVGKKKGGKKSKKKEKKTLDNEVALEFGKADDLESSSSIKGKLQPRSEDMSFHFAHEFSSDEEQEITDSQKVPDAPLKDVLAQILKPSQQVPKESDDQEETDSDWERKAQEEMRKMSIKEQREAKRQLDAEKRRRETERRRREAEQRKRDELAEMERRLKMEEEMELQRQRREEEARLRRDRERNERERKERELEEAELRAQQAKERARREKERFQRQLEEMRLLKLEEEEKKRQEELERQAEAERRRKEEEEMLAEMEEQARLEYLRLKAEEEERIRIETEKLRRQQEAEAAAAIARAKKLAAELAAKREAELRRHLFIRSVQEEKIGHERYLGITPAFSFSYFDLLKWVGMDLKTAVKAQVQNM